MSVILVTGAAGFIGYHTAERLLHDGHQVVGIDNLNGYYDVRLKEARLARLRAHDAFAFHKMNIADGEALRTIFGSAQPTAVVHLAAYAGVRHSLTHPEDYVQANLVGFANVLESCRHQEVRHLVYASSSSVYGGSDAMPLGESDRVDRPLSVYAASKSANELMAHAYGHLFGLATTGLRFFTVYGPWGRPDMAMFLFARAMVDRKPIQVFNRGQMRRDFTFVDDVVEAVVRVVQAVPAPVDENGAPEVPHRLYNIGSNNPVNLLDMIGLLENELGLVAEKVLMPMQPGDVVASHADVRALEAAIGYRPATPIEVGVQRFVAWFRAHHDA